MDTTNMVDITPPESEGPVYSVEPTPEQIADLEKWQKEAEERELLETQKAAAREKALSKLEKLGITQEELSALLGS